MPVKEEERLTHKIFKVIMEHDPRMLTGDLGASAEAAAALAVNLGGVLASTMIKGDEEMYEAALRKVMEVIRDSTEGAVRSAFMQAEDPSTRTRQ
jgi:hypothetical protein